MSKKEEWRKYREFCKRNNLNKNNIKSIKEFLYR